MNKKLLGVNRKMQANTKIAHGKTWRCSSDDSGTELKEFALANRNGTGIVGATLWVANF